MVVGWWWWSMMKVKDEDKGEEKKEDVEMENNKYNLKHKKNNP